MYIVLMQDSVIGTTHFMYLMLKAFSFTFYEEPAKQVQEELRVDQALVYPRLIQCCTHRI